MFKKNKRINIKNNKTLGKIVNVNPKGKVMILTRSQRGVCKSPKHEKKRRKWGFEGEKEKNQKNVPNDNLKSVLAEAPSQE